MAAFNLGECGSTVAALVGGESEAHVPSCDLLDSSESCEMTSRRGLGPRRAVLDGGDADSGGDCTVLTLRGGDGNSVNVFRRSVAGESSGESSGDSTGGCNTGMRGFN